MDMKTEQAIKQELGDEGIQKTSWSAYKSEKI